MRFKNYKLLMDIYSFFPQSNNDIRRNEIIIEIQKEVLK